MKGTFRTGDMLSLSLVEMHDVQLGDVVVFLSLQNNVQKKIVHRVVFKNSRGLITRGDSAGTRDPGLVTEDMLVGRVISRQRNNRISMVRGGRVGQLKGRLLNIYWALRRKTNRLIEKPYTALKHSGMVCRVWKPRITRILLTTENNGPLIQFIHGKRLVARLWPGQNKFECRKPWDLVINPNFWDGI
jgi:hypothetical protein